MRQVLTVLIGGLLGLGLMACAGSGTTTKPSPVAGSASGTVAIGGVDRDPSGEEELRNRDVDDAQILGFGRAAGVLEAATVTALVKRYYARAAAGDGAEGCMMLYSTIAESIVESYGRPPGPPALRGKTCATVMSKLYGQRHRELAEAASKLRVAGVRVKGDQGLALLSLGGVSEPHVLVRREDGAWKIDVLFAIGMD